MQGSKLKPCPFCGSLQLSIVYAGQPAQKYAITCVDCGAASGFVPVFGSGSGANPMFTNPEAQRLWDARSPVVPRFCGVFRGYINCPACEGADGEPSIRFFDSMSDVISQVVSEFGDGEFTEFQHIVERNEHFPVHLRYVKGRHCVESLLLDFGNDANPIIDGPWKVYRNPDGIGIRDRNDAQVAVDDIRGLIDLAFEPILPKET